jgi:acetyltransferase-like isoleucine patch superfamily enzyme
MNSFYSEQELANIGFRHYGENVLISRFARFYSPEKIKIGNNVRIDDFCILSGDISIGSNIHISAYVGMYAKNGIVMEDYSGISPRCTLFSAMDDFSGDFLIGAVHPKVYTNVTGGPIIIKKFAQIGANSVVFPNLTIREGTVVGAFTLVTKSLKEWSIYTGIPAKWNKNRSKLVMDLIC